jgi:hypothetical protein
MQEKDICQWGDDSFGQAAKSPSGKKGVLRDFSQDRIA